MKVYVVVEHKVCDCDCYYDCGCRETKLLFVCRSKKQAEAKVAELDKLDEPKVLAYKENEAGVEKLRASGEFNDRYDANGQQVKAINDRWYEELEKLAQAIARKHGIALPDRWWIPEHISPYTIETVEMLEEMEKAE